MRLVLVEAAVDRAILAVVEAAVDCAILAVVEAAVGCAIPANALAEITLVTANPKTKLHDVFCGQSLVVMEDWRNREEDINAER